MIKKPNGFNYNSSSSAILNEDDFRLYVRRTSNKSTKPKLNVVLTVLSGFENSGALPWCNQCLSSFSSRAANAHPLSIFEMHDLIPALCSTCIVNPGNSFKSRLGNSSMVSFVTRLCRT